MHFPEVLEDSPFNLRAADAYLAPSYLIATVTKIRIVSKEMSR